MTVNQHRYTVTVSGGTGSISTGAKQYTNGNLMLIAIKAPNAAAEYDMQVYDDEGYLLYAENDIVGTTSISMERLCNSKISITISGASHDGSYNLCLYSRG